MEVTVVSQHTPPERTPRADRPAMPAGYGVDPTITPDMVPWSWAEGELERSRNYWLSTAGPNGRPHAAPVWGVWLDGALYFGTDRASRKGRNLAARPRLVAHLESGDNVVILEGDVVEVTDTTELERASAAYAAKYDGTPLPTKVEEGVVVYALRPQVALGWREQDFPSSATRWRFSRR